MLMEIYLSEEKAKKNNIDLDECYQKIDKYFKSRGVEIVSKGIYKGVKELLDNPELRKEFTENLKFIDCDTRKEVKKIYRLLDN